MAYNLDLALGYARYGVAILPCREADARSGAKAKAPYIMGGWHNASNVEGVVRDWWRSWPNAVVGLPCMSMGLFVLDADRHGQSDGVLALWTIFAHHRFDWDSVPCIVTPNNGRHVIFRRPAGLGATKGRLTEAVDVRDKGYIIAAGSMLADGRQYRLVNGTLDQLASAISLRALPVMPDWLVRLADPYPPAKVYVGSASGVASSRHLLGLTRTIYEACNGERNAKLHWAACRCGELISRNIISHCDAEAVCVQAAISVGLSEFEAVRTFRSGARLGMVGLGR